jgi:hypothetical protein
VLAASTTYIEFYGASTTWTSAVLPEDTPLMAGGGKSFIHLTGTGASSTVVVASTKSTAGVQHTTSLGGIKTSAAPSPSPSNAAARVDGRPAGMEWVALYALPALLAVAVLAL